MIRVNFAFPVRARSIACSSARREEGEPSTPARTLRNKAYGSSPSALATSSAERTPIGLTDRGSTTIRCVVLFSTINLAAWSSVSSGETRTTGVAAMPPAVADSTSPREAEWTMSMSETTDHSFGSAARCSANTITAWIRWVASIRATTRSGVVEGHVTTPGCIASITVNSLKEGPGRLGSSISRSSHSGRACPHPVSDHPGLRLLRPEIPAVVMRMTASQSALPAHSSMPSFASCSS